MCESLFILETNLRPTDVAPDERSVDDLVPNSRSHTEWTGIQRRAATGLAVVNRRVSSMKALTFLIALTVIARGQDSISLKEAVRQSMTWSMVIEGASTSRDAAIARVYGARVGLLPKVNYSERGFAVTIRYSCFRHCSRSGSLANRTLTSRIRSGPPKPAPGSADFVTAGS